MEYGSNMIIIRLPWFYGRMDNNMIIIHDNNIDHHQRDDYQWLPTIENHPILPFPTFSTSDEISVPLRESNLAIKHVPRVFLVIFHLPYFPQIVEISPPDFCGSSFSHWSWHFCAILHGPFLDKPRYHIDYPSIIHIYIYIYVSTYIYIHIVP